MYMADKCEDVKYEKLVKDDYVKHGIADEAENYAFPRIVGLNFNGKKLVVPVWYI